MLVQLEDIDHFASTQLCRTMQDKNPGGFMPLVHVLWYLDKYVVDCGRIDAAVVVDETPAMTAQVAMSDTRTKVSFLAVSAIWQKDFDNAVGGALGHAIIMRYMLDTGHGGWCNGCTLEY